MIRVVLPSPLRALAQVGAEISVPVSGEVTLRRVLDVIAAQHPALRGTNRCSLLVRWPAGSDVW